MNVIEYIDGRIEHGISHPNQVAVSPEELEAQLWALDDVRNFIVSSNDPSQRFKTYPCFLMGTECQAATYCYRKRLDKEVPSFDGLSNLWKQFIQWRDDPEAKP